MCSTNGNRSTRCYFDHHPCPPSYQQCAHTGHASSFANHDPPCRCGPRYGWMTAHNAVLDVCNGTCTITVAGTPRVLKASRVAPSAAPVHKHATLAALRSLCANPQFTSATQADKLLKQGCKARLVLVQGRRHTGTACTICASAVSDSCLPTQALDPTKLSALLDEKSSVFQPVPAGLPPDRGVGHVIPTLPGARKPSISNVHHIACRQWSELRSSVK
jgi:hypothetical protein